MIKNKIYNLLAFATIMALIVLLLCMGIIAVQKSMKLNLSFAVTPIVYCEILVNGEPVFDNKTSTIASGVSLSGNVLTFNSAVSDNVTLGENFDLQITNHADTESAIVVSFSGATINEDSSYSEIIAKGEISAVLDVSTTTKMEITFTKAVEVGLTLSEGVSLDAEHSNLLHTTAGVYYLEQGKNLEVKIIVADGYQTPRYTLNGSAGVEITNDTISINYSNLLNANGELKLDVNVELSIINLEINFTFSGSYITGAYNDGVHFDIIATNDKNFQMATVKVFSSSSGSQDPAYPICYFSNESDKYYSYYYGGIGYLNSSSGEEIDVTPMTDISEVSPNEGKTYIKYENVLPTSSGKTLNITNFPPGYSIFIVGSLVYDSEAEFVYVKSYSINSGILSEIVYVNNIVGCYAEITKSTIITVEGYCECFD